MRNQRRTYDMYRRIFERILWCGLLSAALWCAGSVRAAEDSPAEPDPRPAQDAAAAPDAGAAPDRLWDLANTAYVNGDYAGAIAIYESILDRGLASARLYYNLGNAYFKEDRTGKAILFYRRALRLRPGNEDVRHNLEVAEARTKDDIESIPEFFLTSRLREVRRTMGCTAWSVFSLGFLAAAAACLLLFLLARPLALRKAGFYGTLAAAVLCAAATWFAVLERRGMLRRDEAVVMVASSAVKSSPDRAATDLFVLHEGTVVRVTAELGDWAEIVIADGKKGWIETRKVEVI